MTYDYGKKIAITGLDGSKEDIHLVPAADVVGVGLRALNRVDPNTPPDWDMIERVAGLNLNAMHSDLSEQVVVEICRALLESRKTKPNEGDAG